MIPSKTTHYENFAYSHRNFCGHLKLTDGYAATPYGTFETNENLKPGKYKIKLTIYDRIGHGKATVSSTVELE